MMHPDFVEMLDIWSNYHPRNTPCYIQTAVCVAHSLRKDLGKTCRQFSKTRNYISYGWYERYT